MDANISTKTEFVSVVAKTFLSDQNWPHGCNNLSGHYNVSFLTHLFRLVYLNRCFLFYEILRKKLEEKTNEKITKK